MSLLWSTNIWVLFYEVKSLFVLSYIRVDIWCNKHVRQSHHKKQTHKCICPITRYLYLPRTLPLLESSLKSLYWNFCQVLPSVRVYVYTTERYLEYVPRGSDGYQQEEFQFGLKKKSVATIIKWVSFVWFIKWGLEAILKEEVKNSKEFQLTTCFVRINTVTTKNPAKAVLAHINVSIIPRSEKLIATLL